MNADIEKPLQAPSLQVQRLAIRAVRKDQHRGSLSVDSCRAPDHTRYTGACVDLQASRLCLCHTDIELRGCSDTCQFLNVNADINRTEFDFVLMLPRRHLFPSIGLVNTSRPKRCERSLNKRDKDHSRTFFKLRALRSAGWARNNHSSS